ncbi:hypothetical protein LMH87_002146 [Akanthomyces muscarius]|uniref:Uncharacterized protein n=1 Tax=Akanthomyces muscarius TaxID=2231603 RepID=A0A9W8Q748_AKAMU|nr:hypothetical protein LMH87_002146 [Akanthomyces muscarius]KAJ4147634.1 hypothetical protein LMH87_002146 [Akanthomyces muscarius]
MQLNTATYNLFIMACTLGPALGSPVPVDHEQEAAKKFGDISTLIETNYKRDEGFEKEAAKKFGDISTLIETNYKRDIRDFANYGLDNGDVAHKKFGEIDTLIETNY